MRSEDARAVAAVFLAAAAAAMVHVFQHLQGIGNDFVRRLTLDMANEPDAAGIMFILGAVQPWAGGKPFICSLKR